MAKKEEDLVFYLRRHKNIEAKELIKELGINCLLRNGTALNYAILYDDEQIFDFIMQHEDVDVNYLYDKKISPLMSAATLGNYHMCEELLKRNADIHYANSFGNTALMEAVSNNTNNFNLIKLFLDYGANPFLKTNYDFTPYDVAKRANVKEIMELMELYKKR